MKMFINKQGNVIQCVTKWVKQKQVINQTQIHQLPLTQGILSLTIIQTYLKIKMPTYLHSTKLQLNVSSSNASHT